MKVIVSQNRDEMGKFRGLIKAFPEIWDGTLLDIGCRSGNFKSALSGMNVKYFGFDLYSPAAVIGNLEQGLPFVRQSFDVVVALDILEHTDNIHKAFGELCRVTRKYVLISLPNAYEIKSRAKFLFGKRVSGKYGLPPEPPYDRHKWLFSFAEAKAFIHKIRRSHGFEIAAEGCLVGPGRVLAVGKSMTRKLPNLLSPWYVSLLKRNVG